MFWPTYIGMALNDSYCDTLFKTKSLLYPTIMFDVKQDMFTN